MNGIVVNLHGGPRHGEEVVLPTGSHTIKIEQPVFHQYSEEEEPELVQVREGFYTPVAGYPQDWEWDGWRE